MGRTGSYHQSTGSLRRSLGDPWRVPLVARILPVGDIEWTALEKTPATEVVGHAGKGRADSIELPRQLRQSILAY
jgi:hypothetical protein